MKDKNGFSPMMLMSLFMLLIFSGQAFAQSQSKLIIISIDSLDPKCLYLDAKGRAGGHPGNWLMPNVRAFLDGVFASVGLMKASEEGAARPHDRYSPGLHHIAWSAADRADVDALYELLIEIGAEILDAPAEYPRYGNGYYAVFFADPDGLKLEYVHWPK